MPFVCRIENKEDASVSTGVTVSPRVSKCRQCLAQGKDYCIEEDDCGKRAEESCGGPHDHITGDVAFANERDLSMDCSQLLLDDENCVKGPEAAFTCTDSTFEICCPGTAMGDRCGDCCPNYYLFGGLSLGVSAVCLCAFLWCCRWYKCCCWALPPSVQQASNVASIPQPQLQVVIGQPVMGQAVIGQPVRADPVVVKAPMKSSDEMGPASSATQMNTWARPQ